MRTILKKAPVLTALVILFLLALYSIWRDLRSSNWKYFTAILVISIVLVVIDETRLRKQKRYPGEQRQSFIRRSSPKESFLYAILFGLMSLIGILFIVMPYLFKGDFTLQNITGNMSYFINITLTTLLTVYFTRKYIKQKRTVDSTNYPQHK